ncbi:MAG: hypothetical protein WC245_00385 [Bacteroidales bacterium]|jgi:hypothetical protein|nr:hypothetical protein [Bacteroidales bacterium]MCB5245198.1 hypothetical protein [Candidatus Cloacimonadota bacterium]MDD3756426.1 hypothetical protein [Bacteroidales bacterium]MDY0401153.1 hypothetical protein [Bacteroidales bacterium]
MNKFKILLIIFIFCLTISNIYGQKVIEGTAHSIITDSLLVFASIGVYYNDSLITSGISDFDGKFKIIIPDSLPYVRLHLRYILLYDNDTIIDLHDKDTIRGKFYFGKKIPKWDLIFNENDARRDIIDGDVKLYKIGGLVGNEKRLQRITMKYGFRYVFILPQYLNQNILESVYRYNKVIDEYLDDEKNYIGWKEKLTKKIKKLKIKIVIL